MPKAVYLLACEHFITSQEGQISLISIFQEVTIQVPRGSDISANAFAPKDWVIIDVIRHSDPAEIGKTFINHIEVIKPDGTGLESKTPFVLTEKGYLNKINATGIPVSPPGPLSIRLWVYEEGQPKPADPIATYDEIQITHRIVDAPAPVLPFIHDDLKNQTP